MGVRYHVIKAGAGAGKTRKLVCKFLEFLFRLHQKSKESEFPLSKILAITFTNAAADEMRERVIKILKGLSIPEIGIEEGIEEELKNFEKEIKKEDARRILDYIIHNYSDLEIKTIDSFVNYLILSIPFSAGVFLTPDMEISSSESYTNYACDLLIKRYGSDENFKNLLDEFVSALFKDIEGGKISWYLKNEISEKSKGFRRYEMNFAQEIDYQFYSELDSQIEGFRRKYGKGIYDVIRGEKNKKSEQEELISSAFYLEALRKYAPYVHLYISIKNELEMIKRKMKVIFLDELNSIARKIVERSQDAEQMRIFEKLGERIFYFMIDEFQDTSRIQWENLCPLIENALSEGGEFFCVGDPKQAIYGFRGGDPELFEKLYYERFFPSVSENEMNRETIEKNYRSLKEIIKFNNKVFAPEHLREWAEKTILSKGYIGKDFLNELERVYAGSSQKIVRKGKGFLFVKKIPKPENEESLEGRIFEKLNEFKIFERFPKSDICFLLRKTEEVQKWTSFLLSKDFSVESSVTMDIRKNFLLRELVELLRFFDAPYNDLSFASFITGKIFEKVSGISSEEFYRYLEKTAVERNERLFYSKFKEDYRELWDRFFSETFRAVGFLPLYDLITKVINDFRVYENFPENAPFLKHFEELISSFEGKGISNIGAFLQKWDKNTEEEESDFILQLPLSTDAIKVMTIHKAKGLQFPVVVLPEISLNYHHKIFKAHFIPHREDGSLRFYYQKKEWREGCEELNGIYKKYVSKGLLEEINVLYVAMTRARDELYLFLPEGRRVPNFYIPLILGGDEEITIGELLKGRKKESEKEDEISILPPRKRWDLKFVRERRPHQELIDQRRKMVMKMGEGIHIVLSKINVVSSAEEMEETLRENFKVLLKNRDFMDVSYEISKTVDRLINFLKREEVLRFFLVPSQRVFREKEILGSDGKIRRIDRYILFDGGIEVVDFKWGERMTEEHKVQLKDYIFLLSQIYPDKAIRGYLIYLDSEKVEEIT